VEKPAATEGLAAVAGLAIVERIILVLYPLRENLGYHLSSGAFVVAVAGNGADAGEGSG
jgi:hypothetical protein